jgi:CRP-like cAMP-binding protein
MNKNLLFFCAMHRGKTDASIAAVNCTLQHTVKTFKRGEYLAYQGDVVSHLFLLSKGRVKTNMVSDSGLAIPMEELSAPFPLAAAFMFAENNRFPVEVIALEDSEVLLISKESVEKQLARCPSFLRGFMAFNANQMQFLSERLKVYSQKGIKAKLAYYILQRENKGSFDLGQTIASLADYFGVERPSLSRALAEMTRDGIIDFKDGAGKIKDYSNMKELLG